VPADHFPLPERHRRAHAADTGYLLVAIFLKTTKASPAPPLPLAARKTPRPWSLMLTVVIDFQIPAKVRHVIATLDELLFLRRNYPHGSVDNGSASNAETAF
jgi:hypothetical protein